MTHFTWEITMTTVKIKKLDPRADLPKQATEGSSGFDLRYVGDGNILLMPRHTALVATGLAVEVEKGYELQVRPRSGLALKERVTVANAPGTVDSDYRGPLGVILANFGDEPYTVKPGDRVAQAVICAVPEVSLELVEELTDTARGEGGFGSTGRS